VIVCGRLGRGSDFQAQLHGRDARDTGLLQR
jgi:hypothetical protein